MTANFGGVEVVPLLGAQCRVPLQCAMVGVEGDDLTQKLVLAIWGLCWYNFFCGR